MVLPGIRAPLDRLEPVPSFGVGDGPAAAEEVRIERSVVLVPLVALAACGVRLPEFAQRVRDGAPIAVHHAAVLDHPLPAGSAVDDTVSLAVVAMRCKSITEVWRRS